MDAFIRNCAWTFNHRRLLIQLWCYRWPSEKCHVVWLVVFTDVVTATELDLTLYEVLGE